MMKKIASLTAAGAMLLVFAVPAFASPQRVVTVVNHGEADQMTVSFAAANTGLNFLMSGNKKSSFRTGNAYATSYAESNANLFKTRIWDCHGCSNAETSVRNGGYAGQFTLSGAVANTGLNGFVLGNKKSSFHTGNAHATSGAASWANVYVTSIVR